MNNNKTITIADLIASPGNLGLWLREVQAFQKSNLELNYSHNCKPIYFIAMTARSGSTMLCSLIKKIGCLGSPDEYLNPRGPFANFHSKHGGETFEEYLRNIWSNTVDSGAIFGIKTAFLDFYPAASLFKNDINELSNFIYLTRLNIFEQAVSLWSAKATHLWHSVEGVKSSISIKDYNYENIFLCLKQLIAERVSWELYFSLQGIFPYRLTYEEICANRECVIISLSNFLGVIISLEQVRGIVPETTPLSTDEQRQISKMFNDEFILRGDDRKILHKFTID